MAGISLFLEYVFIHCMLIISGKYTYQDSNRAGGNNLEGKVMKKRLKYALAILFALTLLVNGSFSALAATESDVLLPYREKLNLLNEELGTQYKIPTNEELAVTDMTVQELNDFYTSMDLNEFEEYILEMHDQNAQNSEARIQNVIAVNDGISARATETEQFYYYSSSNRNYFTLKSKIVTVNSVAYYNSFVNAGYNSKATGYPYYVPMSISYSVSSDSRQMTVSYNCSKYISATLIDTGYYTINVTYTAGA